MLLTEDVMANHLFWLTFENLTKFGSFSKETSRMVSLDQIFQNLISGHRIPPLDLLLMI